MDSLTITDEIIDKMNVYNLRNFHLDRRITIANYQKADLIIVFAKAALKMKRSTNVDFNDDSVDLLAIKGKILPGRFNIPAEEMSRSLENIPPFGMEDIFNFLIFKSGEYDRHKIASYKAFEDYGLFEDGHVEDVKIKVEGHFIFVGKVKPTTKSVTKEGKKIIKFGSSLTVKENPLIQTRLHKAWSQM